MAFLFIFYLNVFSIVYQPHPLCPPLLSRRGGRLGLKGLRPFKLPLDKGKRKNFMI